MRISEERLIKAVHEGKILPYEEELIERLRDLNYKGIPLSVVLLCKAFCRGECYMMSINISRAMDQFKLVHGDVNFLSKNEEYPNHSWVEKDGFVYDTTDGIRWDKDLYYELFQPVVLEVYDEESVKDYDHYKIVLSRAKEENDPTQNALMMQYIELLADEERSVNHKRILNEINIWREINGVTERFSDEAMKTLRKIIDDLQGKNS